MADKGANDLSSEDGNKNAEQNLDELLDSALEDFDNLPQPKSQAKANVGNSSSEPESPFDMTQWDEDFMAEAKKEFMKTFQAMMGQGMGEGDESFDPEKMSEQLGGMMGDGEAATDPEKFQEQLQKMAQEANKFFAQEAGDNNFSTTISDTLKSLTENAESLQSDLGNDELSSLLSGLGLGGAESSPDFAPFMQNIMSTFLSKEILYPSMKEIVDKYPSWLAENKGKIEEKEYNDYVKQFHLMEQACAEFEQETPTESAQIKKTRFSKILSLMEEMQKIGQPPKDLVGVDSPFTLDEKGLPNPLPGMDPSQCSIM